MIVIGQAAPKSLLFSNSKHVVDEVVNKTEKRARQFTFPDDSTSQGTFIHNGQEYEIQTSQVTGRYPDALTESGNRRLSILPLLKGMQVGLDFRMPFFNIPFGNLLSLTRPSDSSSNLLGFGLDRRALSSLAAIIVTSLLFFPKVLGAIGFGSENKELFRENGQTDDYLVKNVNKVLSDFNIDGDSCIQTALCTIGTAQRQRQKTRSTGTTTHIDVIETLLNLSSVKDTLNKTGWRQAREYGFNDGDCDTYNPYNKCPLKATDWSHLLTNVGKVL
ncbi:uncharacterized protein LOC111617669 [Centruroides sculpturatus]|uniref:uncharacterized protein LOC111617669 n=2 Tax=Centruroides sculpturatus TaxID=218467 RepID=UPI000C6D2650|nr:uncharacterized protein LOC111617669 [Centruroides sculpturatus]